MMTAPINDSARHSISESEIRTALDCILRSKQFAKAPRARRLLRFLVEKTLLGNLQDLNEYAIGLDVFDRPPSSYNTTEDPIVRVQIGRLREKLKAYYSEAAKSEAKSGIEISIPTGGYGPVFRQPAAQQADLHADRLLAIHPFRCISHHGDGRPFTLGLDEELMHQLFKAFGHIVVLHAILPQTDIGLHSALPDNMAGVRHLLEGSVQIDAKRIKASIRLLDVAARRIAWSEQFDRDAFYAITLQEELALSICSALEQFFRRNA